jgi:hypothetical protein
MLLTEYKSVKQQMDERDAKLAELKAAYDKQAAQVKAAYLTAEQTMDELRESMLVELKPPIGQNMVITDPDGSIEITWRTSYDLVDAEAAIAWLRENGYDHAIKPAEVRKADFNTIAKARYEAAQPPPNGCMPEKKPVLTVRLHP